MIGSLGYLLSKLRDGHPRLFVGNNAVQFTNNALIFHSSALVLGNVIVYGYDADPECCGTYGDECVQLGRHEQAHTYQYQVLGLFFIPVYLLLMNLRQPLLNPFERAAQRFGAGQGSWWP
jgi:hypothetical protein